MKTRTILKICIGVAAITLGNSAFAGPDANPGMWIARDGQTMAGGSAFLTPYTVHPSQTRVRSSVPTEKMLQLQNNLYLFCDNDPVNKIDYLGLTVMAILDTSTGIMTVFDNDTREGVVVRANTGGSFEDGDWVPDANGNGAPKGTYTIVAEPSGEHDNKPGGPWYGLFKNDLKLDDATWDGFERRTGLRLHVGSHSLGCVTVDKTRDDPNHNREKMLRLIRDTQTDGTVDFKGKNLKNFGTLTIK